MHEGRLDYPFDYVDTALFDYDLPEDLIAHFPAADRDQSRLLVVNRGTGQVANHMFTDLPDLLPQNIHAFRNNVCVLKARLFGERESGGKVECLLLRPTDDNPDTCWWALLKPGKKLPVNSTFADPGHYRATVLERSADGQCRVQFELLRYTNVTDLANACGQIPLPPYIKREAAGGSAASIDEERYQTLYADRSKPFAAAAPTAGLHFTEPVIERMQDRGVQFHDLTLHVGMGTFRPIQTDQVEQHVMHSEFYEIPAESCAALHARGHNLKLAIGTTSLRAMEDFFRSTSAGNLPPGQPFYKEANLFIYPPQMFSTDILLTNFHLPKSTLLCLVSAFLSPGSTDGIAWLRQIYHAAIQQKYRFFSYGDAMLIL